MDSLTGLKHVLTYVDDALQQLQSQRGTQVALETGDDKVELLLLEVCKLDAIYLLGKVYFSGTYEKWLVAVLVVIVERVRDADLLQEHVLSGREAAVLHLEADCMGHCGGSLTVFVQDRVPSHGNDEELRNHVY